MWSEDAVSRPFLKLTLQNPARQAPANEYEVVGELHGPHGLERRELAPFLLPSFEQHPDLSPELGRSLGKALFTGGIRALFHNAVGKVDPQRSPHEHIPVLLQVGPEPLRLLPWRRLEAPVDSDDWRPLALSAQHPLVMLPASQNLKGSQALPLPSALSPLRLLTLISHPVDLAECTALAPFSPELLTGLKTVPESLRARHTAEEATLAVLDQHLRARRYHLLHLVCHGGWSRVHQESLLYLMSSPNGEHPGGRIQALRAGVFLEWLKERPQQLPQLLFLTMCDSARPEERVPEHNPLPEAWQGKVSPVSSPSHFAARLVTEVGIPLVIGMEGKLPLNAGPLLIQRFLQELMEHGSPALALSHARRAYRDALLSQERRHTEAFLPVLYAREQDYFKLEEALQGAFKAGGGSSVRSSAQLPRLAPSGQGLRGTGMHAGIGVSSPLASSHFPELNLAYYCDRDTQWDRLKTACESYLDQLLVLPGSEREGHPYFNGRFQLPDALRALRNQDGQIPRVITIRPLMDSPTLGLQAEELIDQLIHTLAAQKDVAAVARTAGAASQTERLQALLSALLHQHVILVHWTYRATEANLRALHQYYQCLFECLSTLRKKHYVEGRNSVILCLQPLEWRYASPVWSRIAQLLRVLNITPGVVREALEAINLHRFLPESNANALRITHLPTLSPITLKDVEMLKMLADMNGQRLISHALLDKLEKLIQEEFSLRPPESRRVLARLERLPPSPIPPLSER